MSYEKTINVLENLLHVVVPKLYDDEMFIDQSREYYENVQTTNRECADMFLKYVNTHHEICPGVFIVENVVKSKLVSMIHKLFHGEYTIAEVKNMLTYTNYVCVANYKPTFSQVKIDIDRDKFENALLLADLEGLDWKTAFDYNPELLIWERNELCSEESYDKEVEFIDSWSDILESRLMDIVCDIVQKGHNPNFKLMSAVLNQYYEVNRMIKGTELSLNYNIHSVCDAAHHSRVYCRRQHIDMFISNVEKFKELVR